MARKNGLKNDTSSSFTFNSRTKTVMADVAQDNIKEKVVSVREVVSGKSNNEIILVLQFYDYDVEKTIQAYVENGAKEALQEWQFSGSKPVKKKRNKKKPSVTQPPALESNAVPQAPESVFSESGSATSFLVNGDVTREPVVNGVLNHELDESPTEEIISNGPTKTTYHVPATSTTSSYPTHSTTSSGAAVSNHFDVSLPNTTITMSHLEPKPVGKQIPDRRVKEEKGAKEKSPSPQPQRPHQTNQHPNRHRAHSGSHGHIDSRDRTASTSSTDGKTGKKHAHLGLERSAKDLHRQTVSLERLRLIFNEEVERSYKRLKSVFDDLRSCLNAREALVLGEVNSLKGAGGEVFNMRQGLAHDLKVKIDRAERMSESELADLRLDIKHFVSDRKIDEDLAKTTRFLYDDQVKEHIAVFGEVVPVKCQYIQHKSTPVSTVSSSEPVSAPVQHIPKPTVDIPTTSTVTDEEKKPNTQHLDASEAHEVAELQRRLKHSLTLEGIPVQNYPERPESAPVTTDSTAATNTAPKPGGPRRDNRFRRRNNRDRPPRQDGPKDDNRVSFNQAPNGERVILIGRKTGPQGSGRPPRGGRGRGGGGRGAGSAQAVNRGANNNNNYTRDNSKEISEPRPRTAPSPSGSRGSGSSPRRPQPQRENSGSLRRGRGRGQTGYNRRSNNNPGGNNSSNVQPNNIHVEEKKEG